MRPAIIQTRTNIALIGVLVAAIALGFHQNLPLTADTDRQFEVPEGFAVEEVYSPEESGSIIQIAFDSHGRLAISREDSTVVRLFPLANGTYEEREITDQIRNSQGIFFDGNDVLMVGEGPADEEIYNPQDNFIGLYRVVDEDGDGRSNQIELIEPAYGVMSDHAPHRPFFGPDGYLYWTIGNQSTILSHTSALSPYRDYVEATLLGRVDPRGHATHWRAPGGAFMRKDLENQGADWEFVAGGFRNQYDGDFNIMGELFTFDSDMEWDRELPWFRPIRTLHVVPGGEYGWRTGSMKLPNYYIDTLPPAEEVGRGSPTGVRFYQSYSYPEEYWGAFLQADWSRGRIVLGHLTRDGASYTQNSALPGECPSLHEHCATENFVYGEPLNVTGVDVGPDGNFYFALGGRGTSGGVYRVVYNGDNAMKRPEVNSPIDRVLTMPQPRSAFSRETAREAKEEMGEEVWQEDLTNEVQDVRAEPERRVRALELLQVYGPGIEYDLLVSLREDFAWELRAASAYYLGLKKTDTARSQLVGYLQDADPFVQRRALEALVRTGLHQGMELPFSANETILPLLASDDRWVRYAAREVLRKINPNEWQESALSTNAFPQAAEALMASVQAMRDPYVQDLGRLLARQLELLEAGPTEDELLQLVRVMHRSMHDDLGVPFEGGGQIPSSYPQIGEILLERFPADNDNLNREIAMTLAYLDTPGAVRAIADELANPDNDRYQQTAYAWALSFMESGWEEKPIEQMVSWLENVHLERWRGGRSFPGFIDYIRQDFLMHLPEAERTIASARLDEMDEELAAEAAALGAPAASEHGLSDEEITEYLIFDPGSYAGDPEAGAAAYETAQCSFCHTMGPIGVEVGPDLTSIAQRFSHEDLVRKMVYPSENIAEPWRADVITTADGEEYHGTVVSENTDEVVLEIAPGNQVTIPMNELSTRETSDQSPMPAGLHHHLTTEELADLLAFLKEGPEVIPDSIRARWN